MKRLLFYVLLVLLWQLLCLAGFWADFLFPSPLDVGKNLLFGFSEGEYFLAVLWSLKRVFQGYFLSLMIGIPLGILNGKFPLARQTLGSLVSGLQNLPSICWLPLSLLWFGLNERAIIFVVFMGAIFSVSGAAEDGVRNVQPLYLKAAKTMGADGLRLLGNVVLPASMPAIFTGMKLGWSFAWRSLMAGELLASGTGLGQVLMMGRDMADMSQVIAVMLIIALIGLSLDRLFFFCFEKRLREKWGLEETL
ncbi:MAG: ABC transporter permease [bacterium]